MLASFHQTNHHHHHPHFPFPWGETSIFQPEWDGTMPWLGGGEEMTWKVYHQILILGTSHFQWCWVLLIQAFDGGLFYFINWGSSWLSLLPSLGIYFPGSANSLPPFCLFSSSQILSVFPLFNFYHLCGFALFCKIYCNFIVISVGSKGRCMWSDCLLYLYAGFFICLPWFVVEIYFLKGRDRIDCSWSAFPATSCP